MEQLELYRSVLFKYIELHANGRLPSAFNAYCREQGLNAGMMRQIIREKFPDIKIPSVRNRMGQIYSRIYEEFKKLCSEGLQPGSFSSFCRSHGVSYKRMHWYLTDRHLRVEGLYGYQKPKRCPNSGNSHKHACLEVPFEEIIFEEAGFLPADSGNVITVKINGHVAVSFPADTDVAAIAKFVRKMGKEAGHVGS